MNLHAFAEALIQKNLRNSIFSGDITANPDVATVYRQIAFESHFSCCM